MRKSISFMLIALLLCLPAWAMAATDYYINVCKPDDVWVRITSDNAADVYGDGTVSYNAATRTLTLNGANLFYITELHSSVGAQRIEVLGENRISVPSDEQMFAVSYCNDLEIFGSGSLTIKNEFTIYEEYYGDVMGYPCVMTEGNMTINGVKIEATSKEASSPIYCIGDMNIKNGADVIVHGERTSGLNSYNMTIEDSNVTIDTAQHGIFVPGELQITGNANVNVAAGTGGVALESVGDMTISDDAQVKASGGWGLWSISGNVVISGGVVELNTNYYASVNEPDLSSYADAAVFAGPDRITAGKADLSSAYYSQKYVLIQPEVHQVSLPTTGDEANLLQWCALACVSLIGMAVLGRKAKKA